MFLYDVFFPSVCSPHKEMLCLLHVGVSVMNDFCVRTLLPFSSDAFLMMPGAVLLQTEAFFC